jgi:hypothetical protein
MSSTERPLDAVGHQNSPVTMPGYHHGRPPKHKGPRFPADPPPVEKIIPVMRARGNGPDGARLRALIVVLWRTRLRISEALDLAETDAYTGPAEAGAPSAGEGQSRRPTAALVLAASPTLASAGRFARAEPAVEVHTDSAVACVAVARSGVPPHRRERPHRCERGTRLARRRRSSDRSGPRPGHISRLRRSRPQRGPGYASIRNCPSAPHLDAMLR